MANTENSERDTLAVKAAGRSPGNGRWKRVLTVLLPAAAVTLGLFAAMDRLVRADEVTLEENVATRLQRITPMEEPLEIAVRAPTRPQPIEVASAPPPPPALSSRVTDVNVPAAAFIVSNVPDVRADLTIVSLPPTPMVERTIQPIRPPVPVYPTSAITQGLEGVCEVRFDVSPEGKPFNVAASCSDAVFVSSAERAMRGVEFAPEIRDGQRVERRNVVYPLVYAME